MVWFQNGGQDAREPLAVVQAPIVRRVTPNAFALLLTGSMLGACSPYGFTAETGAFGEAVTALSGSVDQMAADLDQNAIETGKLLSLPKGPPWPVLSAACSTRTPNKDSCGIVMDDRQVDRFDAALVDQLLKKLEILKKLAGYSKALASISNAKDRAELDQATAKLAVSLGTFSADLAPVVGAGTRFWGLAVGTILDHRRLKQMQLSVTRIDPLLKDAAPDLKVPLNALVQAHYSSELSKYRQLQLTLRQTSTETLRRDMIADLLEGAANLRRLQSFKPDKLIDQLVASHGALTKALTEGKPDAAQLLALLEEFQTAAEDLRAAVDAE